MKIRASDQRGVDLGQARFVVGDSLDRCGWPLQMPTPKPSATHRHTSDKGHERRVLEKTAACQLPLCPVRDRVGVAMQSIATGQQRKSVALFEDLVPELQKSELQDVTSDRRVFDPLAGKKIGRQGHRSRGFSVARDSRAARRFR
jgi:hypothetical protein